MQGDAELIRNLGDILHKAASSLDEIKDLQTRVHVLKSDNEGLRFQLRYQEEKVALLSEGELAKELARERQLRCDLERSYAAGPQKHQADCLRHRIEILEKRLDERTEFGFQLQKERALLKEENEQLRKFLETNAISDETMERLKATVEQQKRDKEDLRLLKQELGLYAL